MLVSVLVNNPSRCVLEEHAGSRTPLDDVISGVSLCQNFLNGVSDSKTSRHLVDISGEKC